MTSTERTARRPPGAILVALVCAGLLIGLPAAAFVYSEHRAIAGAAIAGLSPELAAVLARMWALARVSHEDRLCVDPFTGPDGLRTVIR